MKPFAVFAEIKPGDMLRADSGFTCLADGECVTVLKDEDGDLVVPCGDGHHCLDGQLDKAGNCVGFYAVKA